MREQPLGTQVKHASCLEHSMAKPRRFAVALRKL